MQDKEPFTYLEITLNISYYKLSIFINTEKNSLLGSSNICTGFWCSCSVWCDIILQIFGGLAAPLRHCCVVSQLCNSILFDDFFNLILFNQLTEVSLCLEELRVMVPTIYLMLMSNKIWWTYKTASVAALETSPMVCSAINRHLQ